ncbi:membrane-spanning 4-domains subfamily A member 12-like isoform X2 [Dasypus novemcinctus]|uniref:membrane-spanning 4-domains subfamily A member 12-like isoform X2 n=1 Tax=Dasypus novemcinctus TaxID=9361 RepID=UPI00265DBD96|nr:membrane-spanning 4-domains subfamily A member 5-like isoform X2 [Dasypus novemcinctus]
MPRSPVWMREETRMLGALQIMIGLIVYYLGLIWIYLLLTQLIAFQKGYIPITIMTAYPFWSAIFFVLSGIHAVLLEKKRSRSLVTYTIVMNIMSACVAVIGILLLLLEFLIFYVSAEEPIWPQVHGRGILFLHIKEPS